MFSSKDYENHTVYAKKVNINGQRIFFLLLNPIIDSSINLASTLEMISYNLIR